MKTLDLKEASELLKLHPQTVRRMAMAGELPAAKPGKCWAFIEDDLLNWLRSRYVQPRQVPEGKEKTSWHSTKGKGRVFGKPGSPSRGEKYANLLGLKTKDRQTSMKPS